MRRLRGAATRRLRGRRASKKVREARCQDLAAGGAPDLTYRSWSKRSYPFARRALGDEADIAAVHDAAWREAYRGVIPGRELERMIARRGPAWWRLAIARRTPLLVLDFGETVVGYVSYGRNRVPALGLRRRDLRALSRAGMSGLRLRPAHVRGGAEGSGRSRLRGLSSSGRWPTTSAPSASIAALAAASCAARMRLSAVRTASASLSALAEAPIAPISARSRRRPVRAMSGAAQLWSSDRELERCLDRQERAA